MRVESVLSPRGARRAMAGLRSRRGTGMRWPVAAPSVGRPEVSATVLRSLLVVTGCSANSADWGLNAFDGTRRTIVPSLPLCVNAATTDCLPRDSGHLSSDQGTTPAEPLRPPSGLSILVPQAGDAEG